MEMFLFFGLATLLSIGNCAQDLCPKSCNCTHRGFNADIAECSILDTSSQKFPVEIATVKLKDQPPAGSFYLREDIFFDLGLEHVVNIVIVNSSLKAVDVNAFQGLVSLSTVFLSHNDLIHIPPETFMGNSDLRVLKLDHNPLQLNPDTSLLQSDSLVELDLSHCDIVQLSSKTFSKLKNLQTINLSYNKIKILDRDVFDVLEFMEEINLAFNEIYYINPDLFATSEDMTTVILRGNPIDNLHELKIDDLKELDASECKLKILSSNTFSGVSSLNNLNLSHNAIETIEADAFSSLLDLTYIYLSNNNIMGPLHEHLFRDNSKLEVIWLSGNPNLLQLNGFDGEFMNLYFYDISYCGLKEITNNTFKNMHFIATLNVSGNSLQHIEQKTFSKLPKLTTLDLSNNKLRSLPLKIFNANSNLQKLYLGKNQFHHLSPILFSNNPKITYLDVSNCHLNYLWNVSDSVMMKEKGILRYLEFLNVAGNNLKKLHLQNFVSLKRLGHLDISENPIECTQSFAHVMEWLILHRVRPNKGKSALPVSLSSDAVSNNVQWDATLRKVCPIPGEDDLPEIVERPQSKPVTDHSIQYFEKLQHEPSSVLPIDKGEMYSSYITSSPNDYAWPLTLIAFAGLCLILALGNIAFLMIYKARRNYRLVSYKSHFPNPLGGLSQVRHKNAPMYQKLYEDCSVPKTPIVKNTQGKCVVTCISDAEKGEAV